jgi:hypothetical protein
MNPEELRRQYESGQLSEEQYRALMASIGRNSAPAGTIGSVTGLSGMMPTNSQFSPYDPSNYTTGLGGQDSRPSMGSVDSRGYLAPNQPYQGYNIPQDNIDSQGRLQGYRPSFRQRANEFFNPVNNEIDVKDYVGKEDYIERMQESQSGNPDKKTYEQLAKEYDDLSEQQGQPNAFLGPRYMNPWGGDMNTNAYLTGRAFGAEKGSRGKVLGMVAGVGNLGLGLARTIGSGYANAKMYDETMDTYRRNRAMDRQYTTIPSYNDTNNTGGSMNKYGGEKKYKNGGQTDMTPMDRYNRIMHSRSYMKNGGRKMYEYGGEMPNQSSELDILMQMKGMNSIDFESEDKNKLYQEAKQMKRMMEEGGEIEQEQPQQQPQQEAQPEIDPKLVEIAQDMTEDFATVEEAQAYLEQEGVSPQMIEQVLQIFTMIKQEQEGAQRSQPPSSGVMNNNMSSGMSMEFRYGGRSKYPKL